MDPWDDGYASAKHGMSVDDNPHVPHTDDWDEWMRGYRSGMVGTGIAGVMPADAGQAPNCCSFCG